MELSEEYLIKSILNAHPEFTREDIERMIREKMLKKNVSRRTALYLLSIDLGVRLESPIESHIKLSELTEGLVNIRVIGRLLWLKERRSKISLRRFVRGKIMDDTGSADIIFWDITLDQLKTLGIDPGKVVEISNAHVKQGLSGKLEIHAGLRSSLRLCSEFENKIPSVSSILKPLDEISMSDEYVDTYGKILSISKIRELKVSLGDVEQLIKLRTLTIGYRSKAIRVVIWRDAVDEYANFKIGENIAVFNAKVKISKYGDLELHISKNSHIIHYDYPIEISYVTSRLSEIKPGYNLREIFVRVLAKGTMRLSKNIDKKTTTLYVIDDTSDASITILHSNLETFYDHISIGNILSIRGFRASYRGGLHIFVDDSSYISINPKDVPYSIPDKKIEFRKSREVALTDKVISIKGKVVEEPYQIKEGLQEDTYAFIIEDEGGSPIRIIYRGDIKDYTPNQESIREGDRVEVIAALVDISSLLTSQTIPLTLRLRAFSQVRVV